MQTTTHNQFINKCLGPIVNIFLNRLHAYVIQCDDKDHTILFATRAGIRIHELYVTWLKQKGLKVPKNLKIFNASRMLSIKAAFEIAPELALTAVGTELSGSSLPDVIKSIITKAKFDRLGFSDIPSMPLHEFMETDHEAAIFTKSYLLEQSSQYRSYLKNLAGKSNRLVLVDSGWKGTSQLLLESAFPEYQWEGLYFGCIGRASILGMQPGAMHGLIFNSTFYDPSIPETSIIIHRHLIESLFEPNMKSCEEVTSNHVDLSRDEAVSTEEPWDNIYIDTLEYIATHASQNISELSPEYAKACHILAQCLCFPNREDLITACGKHRSHDLGREGAVPVFFDAKDRFMGDSSAIRIDQAIWQTAQVTLEYDNSDEIHERQQIIVNNYLENKDSEYFAAPSYSLVNNLPQHANKVAVITRTKNRPMLLKRAAESVASQSFTDYSWVVVNDGGDLNEVIRVITDSAIDPTKVTICSNKYSAGMEAASNIGIKNSDTEYVVIHDDDDSWSPQFLSETVSYLDRNKLIYGGVITSTVYISEEIAPSGVIEHGRWPYNPWVSNVHLSEMVIGNFFAPIAFMFRRDIYNKIEGYDENLPVLGDWDFNLRYLLECDIGVLNSELAFYHHRDRGNSNSSYSNSVIGGIDRHAAYNSVVRNKFVRLGSSDPKYSSIAVLMGTAFGQADIRHRLNSFNYSTPSSIKSGSSALQANPEALYEELDKRWIELQILGKEDFQMYFSGLSIADKLSKVESLVEEFIKYEHLIAPSDFCEKQYLAANHDVSIAVANGLVFSGYDHYIKYGKNESRARATRRQD